MSEDNLSDFSRSDLGEIARLRDHLHELEEACAAGGLGEIAFLIGMAADVAHELLMKETGGKDDSSVN